MAFVLFWKKKKNALYSDFIYSKSVHIGFPWTGFHTLSQAQFEYQPKVKLSWLKGTADRDTVRKLQLQRPGNSCQHMFGSMSGEVIETKELIKNSTEDRSTKQIRIKLPFPHLIYYPGDHIAIYATNNASDAELTKFLSHFELDADLESVLDKVNKKGSFFFFLF